MDAKTGANTKTGKLTLGDKNFSFPLYDGTLGPEVMDIAKLYSQAGIFTYDPGFTSTASCRVQDHVYRRRQRCAALPRLPD